jgi:hypothetical protein
MASIHRGHDDYGEPADKGPKLPNCAVHYMYKVVFLQCGYILCEFEILRYKKY